MASYCIVPLSFVAIRLAPSCSYDVYCLLRSRGRSRVACTLGPLHLGLRPLSFASFSFDRQYEAS